MLEVGCHHSSGLPWYGFAGSGGVPSCRAQGDGVINHPGRPVRALIAASVLMTLASCASSTDAEVASGAPPSLPELPGSAPTGSFGDEQAWRSLASYNGPLWDDVPDAGAVTVLPETITIMDLDGSWAAAGLVRNETMQTVAGELHAVLHGVGGEELGHVATELLVTAVRPGEPAPFFVRTDVPAGAVRDVTWEVREAQARNERGVIELMQWWQRPADQARPIDTYLHRESADGPFPYALFGGVTNLGDAVGPVDIVAAWLDDDGRVQWVASVALTEPTASQVAPSLEPRSVQVRDAAGATPFDPALDVEHEPIAPPTTAAPVPTTQAPDENQDSSVGAVLDSDDALGGSFREGLAPTTTTTPPPTSPAPPTAASERDVVTASSVPALSPTASGFILSRTRPDTPMAASLAPGAQADFLFLIDAAIGRSFTGSVLLWAVPR